MPGNINPQFKRYLQNTKLQNPFNNNLFNLTPEEYDCKCCPKGNIAGISYDDYFVNLNSKFTDPNFPSTAPNFYGSYF